MNSFFSTLFYCTLSIVALGLSACKEQVQTPPSSQSPSPGPGSSSQPSPTPTPPVILPPPPTVTPTPPAQPISGEPGNLVEPPLPTKLPQGVHGFLRVNGSHSAQIAAGELVRVEWLASGVVDFKSYISSSGKMNCPASIATNTERQRWRNDELSGSFEFLAHPCQVGQTFRLVIQGFPSDQTAPSHLRVPITLAVTSWKVTPGRASNDLTQIRVDRGNGQLTNQNQELAYPMVAKVFGPDGLPAPRAPVVWKVLGSPFAGWLSPRSDPAEVNETVLETNAQGEVSANFFVRHVDPFSGPSLMPFSATLVHRPDITERFSAVLLQRNDFVGRTVPSVTWLSPESEDSVIEMRAGTTKLHALQFQFSSSHSMSIGRLLEGIGIQVSSSEVEFINRLQVPSVECAEGIPLSDAQGIVKCSLRVGHITGETTLSIKVAGHVEFRRLKLRVVP